MAEIKAIGDEYILGQAALAKFLTEKGYPISRVKVAQLVYRDQGPPTHGMWMKWTRYLPAEVLRWAAELTKSRQPVHRGPSGPKKRKAAAAPAYEKSQQNVGRVPADDLDDLIPPI